MNDNDVPAGTYTLIEADEGLEAGATILVRHCITNKHGTWAMFHRPGGECDLQSLWATNVSNVTPKKV
jgi:hypothetical protein